MTKRTVIFDIIMKFTNSTGGDSEVGRLLENYWNDWMLATAMKWIFTPTLFFWVLAGKFFGFIFH